MLHRIVKDTISFGEFTLSSGQTSNIYYDLRKLTGQPDLMIKIIKQFVSGSEDHICGVPYGGISWATTFSLIHNKSQIILRKEIKKHGLGKLIEGVWKPGDKVALIDDVLTTGKSMKETKKILEDNGLIVTKIYVVLCRDENDINQFDNYQYIVSRCDLDSLYLTDILKHLYKNGNLCFAADYEISKERLPDFINTEKIKEECIKGMELSLTKVQELSKNISIIKIHPEFWNDEQLLKLRNISDNCLLWADIKINEVPHIALQQLKLCTGLFDLVSIMTTVGSETLLQLNHYCVMNQIELILVPSIYSNGELIWEDTNLDKLLPTIYKCYSIVGSVNKKIPGLIYIKAGINEYTDLNNCDLIVRGRSLMK